jgi:hypothetical protein
MRATETRRPYCWSVGEANKAGSAFEPVSKEFEPSLCTPDLEIEIWRPETGLQKTARFPKYPEVWTAETHCV